MSQFFQRYYGAYSMSSIYASLHLPLHLHKSTEIWWFWLETKCNCNMWLIKCWSQWGWWRASRQPWWCCSGSHQTLLNASLFLRFSCKLERASINFAPLLTYVSPDQSERAWKRVCTFLSSVQPLKQRYKTKARDKIKRERDSFSGSSFCNKKLTRECYY